MEHHFRNPPSLNPRHLVVALLEDRSDALVQTMNLLHRRAFRIDDVVYGRTEQDGIARLTLAFSGAASEAERLCRELGRLLYVLKVDELTRETASVARELALIKVAVTPETRPEVVQLCEVFRGRVVDVAPASLTVELTGDESKIASCLDVLRPFGILEMVRSGPLAMGRAARVLQAGEHTSSWLADRRERAAARSN